MNLIFSGCSNRGLVRTSNEDAILMHSAEHGALFLVADGIGGREHGEIVSGMLRDSYYKWWQQRFLPNEAKIKFQTAMAELKDLLIQVNQAVISRFGEWNAGSTLSLLFLSGANSLCLSTGDSRIYHVRGISFRQLTVDDIYENLDKKDKKYGKSANGKLLSAVGLTSPLNFSIRTGMVKNGDRFFLCSDGVYRFISPKKLQRSLVMNFSTADKLVERLSAEVEHNGAEDNYSMIYIRVRDVS